jgi:signal peptidase I
MFSKSLQYSYTAQKYQRTRYLKLLFVFIAFIVVYNAFSLFFFSVWVLDNDTMQSGLHSGDRIIFTSLPSWMPRNKYLQFYFNRGDIVLVDKGRETERKLPLRIIDMIVRFFSIQKVSIFSAEGQHYIKRIIGLPGDEISMTSFVFRVKPSSSVYSLTEFELSKKPYYPSIPQIPAVWDESIPFSGNMNKITISDHECFVVSDDRSNTNDSRTWGPVLLSMIKSRAVFRFWPLKRIGIP